MSKTPAATARRGASRTSKKSTPKRATVSSKKTTATTANGLKTPGKPLPNYQAALRYLYDRVDLERTRAMRLAPDLMKLDRMRELMRQLDDPQESLRFVHVAGTKGKGSVCAMIAAGLQNAGYAVGVFTSPHLVDVRERIAINGVLIPTAMFADIANRLVEAEKVVEKKHGKPTFFEMMTAIALCYFADKAVDVAVLEVGLGGRLDATNIITPLATVITEISVDHTQMLGETLEEIATEKAGIFKPNVPAISARQTAGVSEVLRESAEKTGASFEVIGKDIDFSYRFESTPKIGPHTCVCLSTDCSNFEHVNVPLDGEHQAINCGLALAAIDKLRERGFDMIETQIIDGLAKTALPGRMEIAWREPRILLDGAHNGASLTALVKSIGAHIRYDSMVMIFGCSEDKDVDELLKQVSLGADKLIFTRAKANSRAMDPHELQQRFGEISGKMTQVAENLTEALDIAIRAVSRDDLICITGSFYLVGEAKKHIIALENRRKRTA